jgi:hypothetical protein
MKTKREIKLKTGEVLPVGLPVFSIQGNFFSCHVQGARPEPYKIRYASIGLEQPSLNTLEK